MINNRNIWVNIGSNLDTESLLLLAFTCKTQLSIHKSELLDRKENSINALKKQLQDSKKKKAKSKFNFFGKGKDTNEPTVSEFYIQFHKSIMTTGFHLLKFTTLKMSINSWEQIIYYQKDLNTIYKYKLFNSSKIIKRLLLTVYKSTFKLELNEIFPNKCISQNMSFILYKLWQELFLLDYIIKKNEQTKDKQNSNSKKIQNYIKFTCVFSLKILEMFRQNLVINDKFILNCFEKKFEDVLLELFNYNKYYTFSIQTIDSSINSSINLNEKLLEYFIHQSVSFDYIEILLRLLVKHKCTRSHLHYIVKNATKTYLLTLCKFQKSYGINSLVWNNFIQDLGFIYSNYTLTNKEIDFFDSFRCIYGKLI